MTAIVHDDARDPAVLTVEEVADILRVSTWTVYQRIKLGELRAVHVGRVVRVPRVALDEFMGAA